MMEKSRCKVIVVDRHEIVREAVSRRIAEDCDVDIVAEAEDGYSALRACRQHKPDIVLLDLSVVHPSGMETLDRLREGFPDTRVIIVSADMSVSNAFLSLSRGAIAFMSRKARGADYVNAINAAINGYTYLPADVLDKFLKSRKNLNKTGNVFGLSAREVEILEACSNGLSTKQVASNLNISVRTVETHRHSIYRKTDCRNIEELSHLIQTV
jgi:DNA-binding NarL/FixJ family response regulator